MYAQHSSHAPWSTLSVVCTADEFVIKGVNNSSFLRRCWQQEGALLVLSNKQSETTHCIKQDCMTAADVPSQVLVSKDWPGLPGPEWLAKH